MILYSLYFCLICQLLVFKDAEGLIGKNVLPAKTGEFPFMASVGLKALNEVRESRKHICGGSLITNQHVLTAAHCLENRTSDEFEVMIGSIDLSTNNTVYDVDRLLTYDKWAAKLGITNEFPINDIAVMTLALMVHQPGVKPVALTELNDLQLHRTTAVIAGWGITSKGKVSAVLQKATVKILTPDECAEQVRLITDDYRIIGKTYLCSSAEPYALVTCGDSGGPLLDKNNVLLGIVRSSCPKESLQWGDFSSEFIKKRKVNVHPSIDFYRDFIEDAINNNDRFISVVPI